MTEAAGAVSVDDLWDRLIGVSVGREGWIDGMSRARVLREQSDELVSRLEGQGIPARAPRHGTTAIGLCTRLTEPMTEYRNSNLIPVQQARNVHGMQKHVKRYIEEVPPSHTRMMVVSGGWVPLAEYREEHKRFARRISRVIADPTFRAAGLEAAFFSIENTIKRDYAGRPMLNLHTHLLVRSHRRLGRAGWTKIMAWIRSRFTKGYVHDGPVRNAAELVKYCFKPAELAELTDAELAELFHQTFRLKFFHPVGPIRAYRQKLDQDKLRLARVPGPGKTWRWITVEKGTRSPADDDTEADPDEPDKLIGVTLPVPKFSPRFEPVLIVQNFSGDIEKVFNQTRVRQLAECAWYAWQGRLDLDQAAGSMATKQSELHLLVESADQAAPASMRHTTTTTVPDEGEEFGSATDPPLPDINEAMSRWGF